MSEIDCESIRMSAMAIADGEEGPQSPEEIDSHLRDCQSCREEIEEMRATNQLFASQRRMLPETDLWPTVNERIQTATVETTTFKWRLLLLFGIPLFGFKFFVLILDASPNLWAKLVPLILIIAIFSYLKANPFRINSELTLEGETTS